MTWKFVFIFTYHFWTDFQVQKSVTYTRINMVNNVSMLIHIKGTRETLISSSEVPLLITHEHYFSVLPFAVL